jgi:hypothetical protein
MKHRYRSSERAIAAAWTVVLLPLMVVFGPFFIAPEMFRSILESRRHDEVYARWKRARDRGEMH